MMTKKIFKPYPVVPSNAVQLEWAFADTPANKLTFEKGFFQHENGSEFDCEKSDLFCCCNVDVPDIHTLFSPEPSAILPRAGIIGVCMRWYSQTSRQRMTSEPVHLDYRSNKGCVCMMVIPANTLRGKVEFDVIFYFAGYRTSDIPDEPYLYALTDICTEITPEESKFASVMGSILFQSEPLGVRVDGQGSLFPVFFTDEPERPLWWLDLDISDPKTQPVEMDTVSLIINKSHADYPSLCDTGSEGLQLHAAALKQIFASVMLQLLVTLRSNNDWWRDIKEYDEGGNTLCSLVSYGYKYLWGDIDPVETPQKLHEKLMQILDSKMESR
jgi:hypothetical protein